MKKILIIQVLSVFFLLLFTSCFKEKGPSCVGNTLEKDKSVIDSFLRNNGLTAAYTFDNQSGVYYSVINAGSGSTVTIDSLVAFKYEGKLFDGTKFTEGTVSTATNPLQYYSGLYTYALLKVKEGGSISIIAPSSSSVAFGCTGGYNNSTGQMVVPANAQIIYTFWLTDVKSQYQ